MSTVSLALRHGVAAARAQDFERARPLLLHATQESPDSAIAWFWLAIASPSADAAIPCMRRVMEIDPEYARAREVLTNLLVTEAKALVSAGHPAKARVLATEALQLDPATRPVWLALASLTDDPVERITMLREASVLAPDDQLIRTRLRQALLARGVTGTTDRAEARACFREAVALDPRDVRVWQALANLADTRAEWLEALRDLLRAAPDHARCRTTLRTALVADATALSAAGSIFEACERWREAIALTSGDVETWLGLAAVTPDQEEATQAIEAAYERDASDPRVQAAMERLRGPSIDTISIEPPDDAFDRFGLTAGPIADPGMGDTPLAQIDTLLDAFADLNEPEPPPAPSPMAAAVPEVAAIAQPATIEPCEPVVNTPRADDVTVDAAPEPIAVTFVDETVPADVAEPADVTAMATPELTVVSFGEELEPGFELAPAVATVIDTPDEFAAPAAALSPVADVPVAIERLADASVSTEPMVAVRSEAPASPEAGANGSSPSTVMIVDDSPTIRKILGLSLERAGYKVIAEADGESAIERLLHVVPDLILLDIAMPKLDGYEVCKRIKQDPRTAGVPVVMLSGKGAFFDKVKGHMAGATEYLTKPFETPAVLSVVSNFCQPSSEVAHG